MKFIDYYVGVPMLFLLTQVNRLYSFAYKKLKFGKKQGRKKILFIELSEMGSLVLAYPSIIKAKKMYKGAEIYFLTFKKNSEGPKILDVVPDENILTVDTGSFLSFLLTTLKTLVVLRRLRITTVIDFELFARFTNVISWLSGASERVGFYNYRQEGLYRGDVQTHRVAYNPHFHMSKNFLALVYSLSEDPDKGPMLKKKIPDTDIVLPSANIKKEEQQAILNRLKENGQNSGLRTDSKIVVINTNTGSELPMRNLPIAKYLIIIRHILEKHRDSYIVLVGLDDAVPDARHIQSKIKSGRIIDFTNKTRNLRELITLLSFSKLFITSDSGPAHFATLTSTPSIVFFGPDTPKLYSPLNKKAHNICEDYSCSPCFNIFNHKNTACVDNLCLKSINEKEVQALIDQTLGAKTI